MNKWKKIELIKLLEEQERRNKATLYLTVFESFYDWQYDFVEATKDHDECCLIAANQIGKTYLGTDIDAMHLLGEYPENWPGHKFVKPPLCWALGYSMEKTRDLLQTALFGPYDKNKGFEGGLVPKEKIISWESATGIPNAVRTVRVKHANGVARIQFWSYSQGQHAIMGDKVDWFHIDEEPKDQSIRPQVLARTINGGDLDSNGNPLGGKGIYTFTPENGRTDLVIQFMDNLSTSQFYMQKGWDDAPHMTKEKCDTLIERFPEHQRDMRSKGSPMLGHGRIYDIADEYILCDPFELEDHWKVMLGVDFGWDHPQAIVKIAHDLEADMIYITNSWKQRHVSANDAWGATKKWAEGYPMAWPHDGYNKEKGRYDAIQLKNHYKEAGFKMHYEHSTWPDGGFGVEVGIYDVIARARAGKLKIFKGQNDLMEEWRQYHRDEKGNIVKVKDDILSALQKAMMMKRFAIYNKRVTPKKSVMPEPIGIIGIGR